MPEATPVDVKAAFGHLQKLEALGLFSCPPIAAARPWTIPERVEYLELLTGGVLFDAEAGPERICKAGTLFWHVPGERTIFRTRPDDPYRCLVVRFSVSHPHRQVPRRTRIGDENFSRELADELLRAFHDASHDRAALALYVFARLLWAAKNAPAEGETGGLPLPLSRLLKALDDSPRFLRASVDEMAESVELSPAHLHLLCRRHLKTTPHRLLLERRVQLAKRLLAGGRLPVKNVSLQCGFDNVESFCRAFRRLAGMAPGGYRNRHTLPGHWQPMGGE